MDKVFGVVGSIKSGLRRGAEIAEKSLESILLRVLASLREILLRSRAQYSWCWVLIIVLHVGVFSQPTRLLAQSPPSDDAINKPTEHGLRLTPNMARGMAREFVRGAVIRQYDVDKTHEDELSEMVARRIMTAVHAVDNADGQVTAERLVTTMLQAVDQAEQQHARRPVFSPEMAKTFGKDMMTLMPHVRGLVRDVAQDIRPRLSMKDQMKFAGQLMAANAALDGFQGNMERWATGQLRPGEEFFDDDKPREYPLDADGTAWPLKNARQAAQNDKMVKDILSEWKRYIETAKEFYGFDETQLATAESILREMESRLDALQKSPEVASRRPKLLIWQNLGWALSRHYRGDDDPLGYLVMRAQRPDEDAINTLGRELKQRIEKIPRSEQVRAADKRVDAKFAEVGIDVDAASIGVSTDAR